MNTEQTANDALANQSTEKLKSVTSQIQKVIENLTSAVNEFDTHNHEISSKKQELVGLEAKLNETYRIGKLEVDLKLKNDREAAAKEFMSTLGMTPVKNTDLKRYQEIQMDFDNKLAAAAAEAKTAAFSSVSGEKKQFELEFKAREAENVATINAQRTVIASLEAQVAELQKQISEDRSARVKEAEARGQNQITVNTSGK